MTIKELADELGISKQAIRKHLEKLPPTLSVTKKGNTIYLNTDVSNFVREKVTRVTSKVTGNSSNFDSNQFREDKLKNNSTSDKKTTNNYEVEKILNEQLKVKDKQLAEKDKQIQTMQKLLNQQQQKEGAGYGFPRRLPRCTASHGEQGASFKVIPNE